MGQFVRDPEIGEVDGALRVDEDVGRLDVSVHDAVSVCGRERVEQLYADLGDAVRWQGPVLGEDVLQAAAVDQLHHDPRAVTVDRDVVDMDDPRMPQPCAELCFPKQPFAHRRGVRGRRQHRRNQLFQRDLAVE